jgi:hypothetical protein
VALHNFRTFMWISTNFTHCSVQDYRCWARLLQVLHKIGSENAHGCTQKAENGFDYDFLERYHKDGDEIIIHIVRITDDETWVSFVNF